MSSRPFIDCVMEALIQGDVERLNELSLRAPPEAARLRGVVCTDDPGGIDLDLGRGTQVNELVASFYAGPRAFFFTGQTALHGCLPGGSSEVLLDHSLGFDSNFGEAIRVLSAGRELEPTKLSRVLGLLRLKASNPRVQFDLVPFLMENVRFARENEKNLRPLDTAVAFRFLDRIDLKRAVDDPCEFDLRRQDSRIVAEVKDRERAVIDSLFASEGVRHQEATAVAIQAILLRLARVIQAKDSDPERVLSEVCAYCLNEFGFFPLTELSLIWAGLPKINEGGFFSPLRNGAAKVVKTAASMAWDMAHLRLLEKAATMSERGSFFLPSFVSDDARWRELLKLNPVSRMLMLPEGTAGGRVLFGRTGEVEFQTVLNRLLGSTMASSFAPDRVSARREFARAMPMEVVSKLLSKESSHFA